MIIIIIIIIIIAIIIMKTTKIITKTIDWNVNTHPFKNIYLCKYNNIKVNIYCRLLLFITNYITTCVIWGKMYNYKYSLNSILYLFVCLFVSLFI